LQSLREYYNDLSKQGIYSPNEAEFQAYYILSHLFQNEFISRAEMLRPNIFKHPLVQLAIECHHLVQRSNDFSRGYPRTEGSINAYSRFFRLLKSTRLPYLFGCVLHMSFVSIRKAALKAMQKAYYCFPDQPQYLFPFYHLMTTLGIDTDEELKNHLDYYEVPYMNMQGYNVACIGKIKEGGKLKNGNFKGTFTNRM
jgi:hypothetical protein